MMQLVGELRGIITRQNGDYTFHYLVVEDENLESHQVQLSKANDNQAFRDGLNKLSGQVVQVPFYIRKFQGRNGQGISFNYSGENLPKVHGAAAEKVTLAK